MSEKKSYQDVLNEALNLAAAHLEGEDSGDEIKKRSDALRAKTFKSKNGHPVPLSDVATCVDVVISNLNQTKYVFSIIVTALATKIVSPKIDIRNAKAKMANGYSNRNTDQSHVTPFLKRNGLTHSATSGMESGRNFERPFPLTLDFPTEPRGPGNREAILGILHAVQVDGVDPLEVLTYLFFKDLSLKKSVLHEYPAPEGLTVQQIVDAIVGHFNNAQGQGKSRLPVLAIQAIYECITPELKRYQGMELVDISRHTANDKKGSIGDVQVNYANEKPFEGVEVKSGKRITADMIKALPIKLQGHVVDRYYILSTEEQYIAPEDRVEVMAAVEEVRNETGCEIIPNGLVRTLWYYLRLISDKDAFIESYTRLLKTDKDVREPQRALWAEILLELQDAPLTEG